MNKKGFTLAELLIVVAIIAVLVAVAVPVFTSQLTAAKQATDLANLRSSYAEAKAAYLAKADANNSDGAKYTKQGDGKLDKVNLAGVPEDLKSAITAEGFAVPDTFRVTYDGKDVKVVSNPS